MPFEIVIPRVCEDLAIKDPYQYVKTLSRLKAEAVMIRRHGIIVSVDTIVVVKKKILGKPDNRRAARVMLRQLSGVTHRVLSGVTVINTITNHCEERVEETSVRFRRLTSQEIEEYIRSREPYDKAGGYGIQGRAGLFVEWIEGDYFNVVGLPLARVRKMLLKHLRKCRRRL